MALSPTLSNVAASVAADAVCALLNAGGHCDIYDGAQPANPDVAVGAQLRLARVVLPDQAFDFAVNGVAALSAEAVDPVADLSGTASWCRFVDADDVAIFDGSVGLTGCNLNLDDVEIEAGEAVTITSFSYTQPKV